MAWTLDPLQILPGVIGKVKPQANLGKNAIFILIWSNRNQPEKEPQKPTPTLLANVSWAQFLILSRHWLTLMASSKMKTLRSKRCTISKSHWVTALSRLGNASAPCERANVDTLTCALWMVLRRRRSRTPPCFLPSLFLLLVLFLFISESLLSLAVLFLQL